MISYNMHNLLQCPRVIQGLGLALYQSQSTCFQYVLSVLGTAIPEGLRQLWLDQTVTLGISKGLGKNCKQGGSCFYSTLVRSGRTVALPYRFTPI